MLPASAALRFDTDARSAGHLRQIPMSLAFNDEDSGADDPRFVHSHALARCPDKHGQKVIAGVEAVVGERRPSPAGLSNFVGFPPTGSES